MVVMNKYINVKKIEVVITNSCSGKCKHCQNGEVKSNESINTTKIVEAIKQLSKTNDIDELMTFGGEPLLYSESVCKIHSTANDCGIRDRAIITNGYFSKDPDIIKQTAKNIFYAGVNDIMVSIDAFHQETIPIKYVRLFVESLLKYNFSSISLHPAWLGNREDENAYNTKTKEILQSFADLNVEIGEGNIIFPAGNAIKYFPQYFQPPEKVDLSLQCGTMPYTSRLDDIEVLGFSPNGNVNVCIPIGNIYKDTIENIIKKYDPYNNCLAKHLIKGGVKELLNYANSISVKVDTQNIYSPCMLCKRIVDEIIKKQ
jgi:MoaA/NifB/PqqE/SkfB family radical SAM enzyme